MIPPGLGALMPILLARSGDVLRDTLILPAKGFEPLHSSFREFVLKLWVMHTAVKVGGPFLQRGTGGRLRT